MIRQVSLSTLRLKQVVEGVSREMPTIIYCLMLWQASNYKAVTDVSHIHGFLNNLSRCIRLTKLYDVFYVAKAVL